ncbi:ARM repeat-containing protein [Marasmius fiardii PR-910]|nr:ARM repeat-containing protein [Marasmius fiardii PR-910]
MESTEWLVRTWMASGREEEVAETVSNINNGSTTLLNVVKALGEYLTSEEDQLRTKGVEFLSSVLGKCSPEKLNRQSVRVLASFYCSKLEDWDTIIPSLQGLAHLTSLPTCTSEDVPKITDSIFERVKMKNLVQSVRHNVFTIFDNLISRHRDVLKPIGSDFVERYVTLVEGEKDPRNLLIAFAIARVLVIEFDISKSVESIFNITFCYFPITFRPPPNDPYGITTEDLRQALRRCLSATPLFGTLAIPLFLEKLTAGTPITKRDTLETMSVCFPVYGSAIARVNARKLWNTLKLEIFQPIDPETEEQALKTTQDLVNTIYGDDTTQGDEDIQGLAKDACEECFMILREPEKSQAKHAIKLLCAFMSTTPSVSRYTVSQIVPYLMKQFIKPDDVSIRPSILLLMSDVLAAAREAITHLPEGEPESPDARNVRTILTSFKDELTSVIISGLKVPSYEELGFIVHNVNELLGDDVDDEDSSAALKLLSIIAVSTPRHIKERVLPQLVSTLPDQAPSKEATTERIRYWRTLTALTTLCQQPELFEILIIRLTTRLDLLCFRQASGLSEGAMSEPDAAYAHSILLTIYKVLAAKADEGHTDIPKYIDVLVPRLFNLFVYSTILSQERYVIGTEPRLIIAGGQVITLVVQSLPVSKKESYIQALFSAYLDGNVKSIAEGQQAIPPDYVLRPFGESASSVTKSLVVLLSSATVALQKEIRIPVPDLNDYLNHILDWSITKSDHDHQREAVWKMIAAILNKRIEDATTFLSDVLSNFWSTRITESSAPLSTRQQAIRAWGWVTRALMVRSHPSCNQFTNRLFDLFVDEELNWHAAKTFGDIVRIDKVLTKRNHAVIKILHTQRFVESVLSRLISGAKTSTSYEQLAHLVALSSLISQIPRNLYARELPSLIPLLIRGLGLPDYSIRCQVIETMLAVAEEDSSDKTVISEHAPSLVTTMLKNSIARDMPSANVRISALKYLGVLPKVVRYDILHPLKATAIRELALALDDPRRLVRKEAVEAR